MRISIACTFLTLFLFSCQSGPAKIEIVRTVDNTETSPGMSGIMPNLARMATVTIKNNTNQTFPYVFVDVYYYGSNNQVIDTAFGSITGFAGNSQTEIACSSNDTTRLATPAVKYTAVIEERSYKF